MLFKAVVTKESDKGANIARAQLHKLRTDFVDRVLTHYLDLHLKD
jgi:predicted aldo/keto reductase-like oxidoreductase